MDRKPWLDDAAHKLVSDAVAAAEAHTSGEIVPVLADRSDGYSDIALAWAAFAAFTALTLLAVFPAFWLGLYDRLLGDWGHEWTAQAVLTVAAAATIGIFIAAWLIQLWPPLKFSLVPGTIKSRRVRERAIAHFKVGAERRTHGATGILIYLLMHEHRAEIVADDAIAAKVAPEVWGKAMADMLRHIHGGRVAEGMAAGIADVGHLLAEHFPRQDNDVNELPDRLIEV